MGAHGLDLDHRPRQLDVKGLGRAHPAHGQADVGIGGAAHAVHRLVQGQALNLLAVQMGDEVAGLDAGAVGRGVVDGRNHLDPAVFHGHFNAQAAEFALGIDVHVLGVLGVQIAGMGIQRTKHAVQGRFHQLFIIDRLDIFGADLLKDVGKQIHQFVSVFIFRGSKRRSKGQGHHDCRGSKQGDQGGGFEGHPGTLVE